MQAETGKSDSSIATCTCSLDGKVAYSIMDRSTNCVPGREAKYVHTITATLQRELSPLQRLCDTKFRGHRISEDTNMDNHRPENLKSTSS